MLPAKFFAWGFQTPPSQTSKHSYRMPRSKLTSPLNKIRAQHLESECFYIPRLRRGKAQVPAPVVSAWKPHSPACPLSPLNMENAPKRKALLSVSSPTKTNRRLMVRFGRVKRRVPNQEPLPVLLLFPRCLPELV